MSLDMQTLVAHAKNKWFVYAGSDIYGGLANSWDYGPLGSILKENLKNLWIKNFVQERRDMTLLDAAILMNPQVWVASGHVGGFSDPLVDCKSCKWRFRADKIIDGYIEDILNNDEYWDASHSKAKRIEDLMVEFKKAGVQVDNFISESWSPEKQIEFLNNAYYRLEDKKQYVMCPNPNCDTQKSHVPEWGKIQKFNLMFRTFQGVTEDSTATIYMRPETAQGIFVNFANIARTSRKKVPFGVAQVGKAFRNEITPGNFIFRTREFEQMEIEYFCEPESIAPGKHLEHHALWKQACMSFLTNTLGVQWGNLRLRDHEQDELSHYSAATTDIEYKFPFGWWELWGIADRTDFDLKAHMAESKQDLAYFDPYTNQKYIPYVIEPSVGLTRLFLAVLADAYTEVENEEGSRVIMKFAPQVAPIKVAILPLVKKLSEKAIEIFDLLSPHMQCEYDEAGTIGKRYHRMDEIGVPFSICIDFEHTENGEVTIRHRDSGEQDVVKIEDLVSWLKSKGC